MNDARTPLHNSIATVLTAGAAGDTRSDSLDEDRFECLERSAHETQFEREPSMPQSALLELAQRAVSERDALRGEVTRLRDALARSEAAQRRSGSGSSRELVELREAVDLREREVRRLKDANVARERLLVEARTRLDEALHARSAAVTRMELRERAAIEAESRLAAALQENAALKRRLDAAESELARALSSERALSASYEDARLNVAEAERAVATLRVELAETRGALAELDVTSKRAQRDHEARVESLLAAHAAKVEAMEREQAELIERLSQRAGAELEGRERGLRFAAAEALYDAEARFARARAAMREELEAALADSERVREEHQLDLVAWRSRNLAAQQEFEAHLEGAARGWAFRLAEAVRELELERAARMCEATRQGQALNAAREAHEFALSALRGRLAREQERVKRLEEQLAESDATRDAAATLLAEHVRGLEAELDAERAFNDQCLEDLRRVERTRDDAAMAIAQLLAAYEARVERVESERDALRASLDECDATREALALETVEAARRASEVRAKHEALEREFEQHARQMAELVGALTRATVEQHAIAGALKRGRVLPTLADVDAALVAVGRRVPAAMAEQLWTARDAIASAVFAGPDATR
jgi:chromosome segregation ATPase